MTGYYTWHNINPFSVGTDFRRQIQEGPRTERNKICILAIDP